MTEASELAVGMPAGYSLALYFGASIAAVAVVRRISVRMKRGERECCDALDDRHIEDQRQPLRRFRLH
jgi:hypothetical protein